MFDVLAPYTFINTRWQQYEHSSLPHYTVLMLLIITQRPLVFCRIRTACARAQFSGCTSKTNTHSETGQIAICSQTMTLGALSSRSALSMLVGALFKKFGLFLNNPRIVAIPDRHVGRTYLSHLQGAFLEDGTDRLSRNVGKELPLLTA